MIYTLKMEEKEYFNTFSTFFLEGSFISASRGTNCTWQVEEKQKKGKEKKAPLAKVKALN